MDRGIRCLGIEPSVNVGAAARDAGVPTLTAFLDPATGAGVRAEHGPADLVVANNVYAHIPDVVGFTRGLRALVADDGWVSIEVQHLLTLIEENQYDTIYHEHFQYYTVASATRALASGGLALVDVELLPTHGGSIRLWARPAEVGRRAERRRVADVLDREKAAGLQELSGYTEFSARVAKVRRDLLRFLIEAAERGETVVGYGAPGKGNTLLNHCGIRPDLLAVHGRPQPLQARQVHPGHPHPDPAARADSRRQTGLRPRPAVEPAGRAGRAAVLRARLGRPAGLPHPGTEHCRGQVDEGRSVLRRLRDAHAQRSRRRRAQADGDGRPAAADLARHALLRALRAHGVHPVPRLRRRTTSRTSSSTTRRRRPTTSCCGAGGPSCCPPTSPTGRSRSSQTGIESPIGERLRRVRHHLDGDEMFLANYADVLTDAPLPEMIDRFAAARRRCVDDGGAAAVLVPLRGPGRRRPGGGITAVSDTAAVGERRLLRAPPGGLRPHPGERGPGRRRMRPTGQAGPAGGAPAPRLLEADRHREGAGRARRRLRPGRPPVGRVGTGRAGASATGGRAGSGARA